MGCGGSKTLEDEFDEHNIQNGIAYDKDEQIDFTQNINEYISKSENYYKNQNQVQELFQILYSLQIKIPFMGKMKIQIVEINH